MNTIAALKSACEALDVTVRSYSGRGMYGRSCVGFVVPRGLSAAQFAFNLAVKLASAGEDDVLEELHGREWSQDSLGLDSIVYIPSLRWEEPDEDEDEEDDSEFEPEDVNLEG